MLISLVGRVGFEPTMSYWEADYESAACNQHGVRPGLLVSSVNEWDHPEVTHHAADLENCCGSRIRNRTDPLAGLIAAVVQTIASQFVEQITHVVRLIRLDLAFTGQYPSSDRMIAASYEADTPW